ncbi:MAG: DUF433 domain-containing protein [Candidatus Roizmanbacteria bacterium]|nr:DUF433 domain-containing protein [Candidatus Roizmanbacteria bacterium]MCR4312722.1 DUF433 domain-containing protein [Candidatus Roizmanbacteria bacterium]
MKTINELIAIDSDVRSGTPCFRGTEIPVSLVIDHIAKGWSIPDLKKVFPKIKTSDIENLMYYLSEKFTNGKKTDETWSFNCG